MAYQFRNASILVVDDMQPMLTLVSHVLKTFGFSDIHLAHDPDEAFEIFCRYNNDLILTDWLMQPYDGVEFVRRVRTDAKSPNKFVPVIMMTGYSHRVRVEQARDIGITEFLVKPFRAKDLYARIELMIEKPRKFVDTGEFFGPDRRRRAPRDEGVPKRREDDGIVESQDDNSAELLTRLKEQIRETAESRGNKPST